jgi:hypothetical protein
MEDFVDFYCAQQALKTARQTPRSKNEAPEKTTAKVCASRHSRKSNGNCEP